MEKNIGLFWLKDDFRLKKNYALIEATKNHDFVVAFYLFKKQKFADQEAQRWWVSQSLQEFKNKLLKYNINLEIIKVDTYQSFFKQLLKETNFSIYWNKTYEPDYLRFDNLLSKSLKDKKVKFKILKGNILNEPDEVKKADGTPFKVFTPYWRTAEKLYIEKIPSKEKIISKCKKKGFLFQKYSK